MLKVLAGKGLIDGKTIGVDATTLEANAAMRSIVRRDTGESYTEFLEGLAKASGIETPTREDLARMDRKRTKTTSNQDWEHPDDPDAKIAKMKDGSNAPGSQSRTRRGHGDRGGAGGHVTRSQSRRHDNHSTNVGESRRGVGGIEGGRGERQADTRQLVGGTGCG